jgi:hypothetical protein
MSVQESLSASITKRPVMASYRSTEADPAREPPMALVLGTGDIASAIGLELFNLGWAVVLLRDHGVPVLRRGMSFDDALECGAAELDGVKAMPAPTPEALPLLLRARRGVVVANLDPAVACMAMGGGLSALVDARMRKYAMPADIRPLAARTVGIGPGFVAGVNVHVAIETLPGHEGGIVAEGTTANPTGKAVPLGGAGAERFVYAPIAGAWQPEVPLGTWLEAGRMIGMLGGEPVYAPIAGCVRGMVRATQGGVARGSKLMEIDPRREATWIGVPPRARRIAAGVETALAAVTLSLIVARG